ncbi:MAG TPA: HEAT repeat domain-containing protein [Geobacteraceae bacterium]|nr:HEAT repeat domain-containing protein [Geobacteraceae bacterium]
MKGFARIDTSLPQRSGLVRLLQRLEREDLSFDEMEKIADAVEEAGQRAIPPLMRRLRKVTSAAVIARYLYLLEYFDEACWFDELFRITLSRNDLDIEAKRVFLAGLERLGITSSDFPNSCLLGQTGDFSQTGLDEIFEQGDTGFVTFLEDLGYCSPEHRALKVRRLAGREEPAAETLLEILLGYSDREVVKEALSVLGGIRRSSAAAVLLRYLHRGTGAHRNLAERNLRKLAFLGISPMPGEKMMPDAAVLQAALGPIEGTGFRSAWFSRWNAKSGGVEVLFLQLHEICGITEAAGFAELTSKEHDTLFRKAVSEEGLQQVSPSYAQAILQDALFHNIEHGFSIPPEFYVWQRILGSDAFKAVPHVPDFAGFDLDRIAASSYLLEGADSLLDEECCAGWISAREQVFDIVDEFMCKGKKSTADFSDKKIKALLGRFMREVVVPEKDRLARRLFLTADLMREAKTERELIERTLCTALNVACEKVPYIRNPFLRRFALESLGFACDALAEGYDLRYIGADWNDGELWD